MDCSPLYQKSPVEMLGLSFFSKLKSSYIASIAKTTPNKSVALIRPVKFLSSEVLLHKSTIQLFRECFYHVQTGTPH